MYVCYTSYTSARLKLMVYRPAACPSLCLPSQPMHKLLSCCFCLKDPLFALWMSYALSLMLIGGCTMQLLPCHCTYVLRYSLFICHADLNVRAKLCGVALLKLDIK